MHLSKAGGRACDGGETSGTIALEPLLLRPRPSPEHIVDAAGCRSRCYASPQPELRLACRQPRRHHAGHGAPRGFVARARAPSMAMTLRFIQPEPTQADTRRVACCEADGAAVRTAAPVRAHSGPDRVPRARRASETLICGLCVYHGFLFSDTFCVHRRHVSARLSLRNTCLSGQVAG